MIRIFLSCFAVALSMLAAGGELKAQTFPNKPITIIVPFAAGGPTDIVARVIAAQFATIFGQQAVVENVVGAAGTIGMVRAARAAPDGYTLLLAGMSTMSFSPTVYPNIQANAVTSFEPVGIVASAPIVLTVAKQVPANTVKEFADHMRTMSDKVTNGHAGVGSSSHLACALVNQRLGGKASVVPYKGTSQIVHDMLAGQIHFLCDQTTSVMTQVQAGGIRALAVLAQQRSPVLPNVPTMAEAGYPGAEMVLWNAIFAPKGTPPEIVKQLNAAIAKGVDSPVASKQFTDLGAQAPGPADRSPEALSRIHRADVEKWGKVIREAGIQPVP